MNRKLLNGLLVLAVAAGGVGTFTSCKDENLANDIQIGQLDLQGQIDAIRAVSDQEFMDNLKDWLNGWTADASEFDSYEDMLAKAQQMYAAFNALKTGDWNNEDAAAIANSLLEWMKTKYLNEEFKKITDRLTADEAAIAAMQKFLDWYTNQAAQEITTIGLNQTYNPITGTLNLPIGLNSQLLATYIYTGNLSNFPNQVFEGDFLYDNDAYSAAVRNNVKTALAALNNPGVTLTKYSYTDPIMEGEGNMGHAIITINPSNSDFSGIGENIQVVDAKGNVVLDGANGDLKIKKYDGDLYFGMTRAESNTGLYELEASAPATDGSYIPMHVGLENKGELVSAVKDAISNHTISDLAHLGEVVYQNLQKIMPAYAVRVKYTEEIPNGGVADKDGNFPTTKVEKYIVSDYKLGAAVVNPLAYTTGLGYSVNKSLPTFSPITEYFERYFSNIKDKVKIDLSDLGGYMPIDITVDKVTIDSENINISLEGTKVYGVRQTGVDAAGDPIYEPDYNNVVGVLGPEAGITLTFDGESGMYVATGDMSGLISSIEDALNTQVVNQINTIVEEVNKMITQINEDLANLDDNINSQLSDILKDIENSIHNKLKYADKLVDLYNKIAERVNTLLKDPNHYLQVMMAYNAGDGMHHLSNTLASPTRISGASKVGGKAGVELFASSYNGDILVPSYKKYVAITRAWKGNTEYSGDQIVSLNETAGGNINQVLSGEQHRVAMGVSGLEGYTLELTYMSLDYHGTCSMQQYYVYITK